jgi:hypothetical protein
MSNPPRLLTYPPTQVTIIGFAAVGLARRPIAWSAINIRCSLCEIWISLVG